MIMTARRQQILSLIQTQQSCSVNQLAIHCGVTARTIRSDLDWLAKLGLIERQHGMALSTQRVMLTHAAQANVDPHGPFYRQLSRHENPPAGGRLCILGTIFIDIVTKVAALPRQPGSLIPASDISFGAGGKGANQALAARVAGAQVHLTAKVGTDAFSRQAWDHLLASGMQSFTLLQTDSASTGCSTIWVHEYSGETLIAINPGANRTFSQQEVASLQPQMSAADLFMVHSGINASAVRQSIHLAHRLNIAVVFYPSPLTDDFGDCLPLVSWLVIGQSEAEKISGLLLTTQRLAERAALQLQQAGARQVLLLLDDGAVLVCLPQRLIWFAACPAVTVDASGANDAFCGAFCARLALGESLNDAVEYASAFAALAREKSGAASMPDRDEVRFRLSLRQRNLRLSAT